MRTVVLSGNDKRKGILTLRQLSQLCLSGKIKANPKNRDGTGRLKKQTLDHIYNYFNVESFDAPTLLDKLDGTFMIIDGHHRLFLLTDDSFLLKYRNVLDKEVDINIITKNPYIVYRDTNTQKSHPVGDHLSNDEFSAGKYISKFINDNNLNDVMDKKLISCLSYFFEGLNHKDIEKLDFVEVYGVHRKTVQNIVSKKIGGKVFDLSESDVKKINKAFDYYRQVKALLKNNKEYSRFKSNAALFLFILTDLTKSNSILLKLFDNSEAFVKWFTSGGQQAKQFESAIRTLTRNEKKSIGLIKLALQSYEVYGTI